MTSCAADWQTVLLDKYRTATSKLPATPPSYVPALYTTEYADWAKLPEIGYDADVSKLYDLAAYEKALLKSPCYVPKAPAAGLGGASKAVHPWCAREASRDAECNKKIAARVKHCETVTGPGQANCYTSAYSEAYRTEPCVKDLCKVPIPIISALIPDAASTTNFKPPTGDGGYGGHILEEYRVSVSGTETQTNWAKWALVAGAVALGAFVISRG